MATPDVASILRRLHPFPWIRAVVRFLLRNFQRIYAAALVLLIGGLTYMAVRYLITSLAIEKGPPPQITALPARLSPDILQTDFAAWQALSATEHTRSPLAHYHRLDSWVEPDQFNDCTRSGCHAALPHSRRKEVRAFLNMHATSIHCGVCHLKSDDKPLATLWYDLKTGKARSAPEVLDLYAQLSDEASRTKLLHASEGEQKEFVAKIRRAAGEVQSRNDLETLADHFEAVRAGSPAFQRLINEALAKLPSHFRGEYGAKIALRSPGGGNTPLLGHPETSAAVQTWLSRGATASAEEKKTLLDAVHPLKRDKALHCTDCHKVGDSLLNFQKLGYPQARQQALTSTAIFKMIEHISTGQTMNLPEMIPSRDVPTSQPSK